MEIKLNANIPTEINLNVSDITAQLAKCNSLEQAEFFNSFFEELRIGCKTSSGLDMQLCYMVEDLSYESKNGLESLVKFVELMEEREKTSS